MIDTPYGPGVVLESRVEGEHQHLKVSVSGTNYQLKSIGIKEQGRVELDD